MVDSCSQPEQIAGERGENLKYFNFLQVAAIRAVLLLSSLYGFAKENAGPLKPGVQAVEGTVKATVSPVYEKYRCVPFVLLKFLDHKVGEVVCDVERRVPSVLKKGSAEARAAAQRALGIARSVAGEFQRSGVTATAAGIARETRERYGPAVVKFYVRHEPAVERYAVAAWRSLNRLPLFPHVAQIAVPTAAYWAGKYNRAVGCAVVRGYAVAEMLPLVPTERIAKVFSGEGAADGAGIQPDSSGVSVQ